MQKSALYDCAVGDVLIVQNAHCLYLGRGDSAVLLDNHKDRSLRHIHIGNNSQVHTCNFAEFAVDNGFLRGVAVEFEYLVRELELDCQRLADIDNSALHRHKAVAHLRGSGHKCLDNGVLGQGGCVVLHNARAVRKGVKVISVAVRDKHFVGLSLEDASGSLDLQLLGIVALVDYAVEGFVLFNAHLLIGIRYFGESSETGSAVNFGLVVVLKRQGVYAVYADGVYACPIVFAGEKTVNYGFDFETFKYFG